MNEWIEIDTTQGRLFRSNIHQEEEVQNKHNLIDNIVQRCAKYGKLDNQHMIARKTGAVYKDSAYEKDQNVYDQEDSFIDDGDCEKENNAMIIPETELDDYHMCYCSLKDFAKSEQYRQRIAIIKKHSTESKNKSAKKKNKQKEKSDQIIEKQNSIQGIEIS